MLFCLPLLWGDRMHDRIYLINLYDIYGELLTEKQQMYFEDYYFSNLSLAEIAENMEVSRNAVHNQIKDAEEKLSYYETNLHLYERNGKIKEIIKSLDEKLQHKIEELL